eukprot:g45008.t1
MKKWQKTKQVLCISSHGGGTSSIAECQGAEMSIVASTKEKVLGQMKGLKVDKSDGPHGLLPRVLKEITEEIVEALVVIFQESLESGRIPEGHKMANEKMSKLDKGEPVDVIYLDFQKAFDKVLHRRLLNKIRVHGVGGKVLAWIQD